MRKKKRSRGFSGSPKFLVTKPDFRKRLNRQFIEKYWRAQPVELNLPFERCLPSQSMPNPTTKNHEPNDAVQSDPPGIYPHLSPRLVSFINHVLYHLFHTYLDLPRRRVLVPENRIYSGPLYSSWLRVADTESLPVRLYRTFSSCNRCPTISPFFHLDAFSRKV